MSTKSTNPIVLAAQERVKQAKSEYEEALKIYEAVQALEKQTPPTSASKIDIDSLPIAQNGAMLADSVRSIIDMFQDQEFMVAHVEAALKEAGKPVEGKSPRSRIAIVLKKLEEQGLIELAFKGGGNVPNKYKRAKTTEEEVFDEAFAEFQAEAAKKKAKEQSANSLDDFEFEDGVEVTLEEIDF